GNFGLGSLQSILSLPAFSDICRNSTNCVWLAVAVAEKKLRTDIAAVALLRGYNFLELNRLAGFDDPDIVRADLFGNFIRENVKIVFAPDFIASNIVPALKFAVNQKVTKLEVLNKNGRRSVIDNVLQTLFAGAQSVFCLSPIAILLR